MKRKCLTFALLMFASVMALGVTGLTNVNKPANNVNAMMDGYTATYSHQFTQEDASYFNEKGKNKGSSINWNGLTVTNTAAICREANLHQNSLRLKAYSGGCNLDLNLKADFLMGKRIEKFKLFGNYYNHSSSTSFDPSTVRLHVGTESCPIIRTDDMTSLRKNNENSVLCNFKYDDTVGIDIKLPYRFCTLLIERIEIDYTESMPTGFSDALGTWADTFTNKLNEYCGTTYNLSEKQWLSLKDEYQIARNSFEPTDSAYLGNQFDEDTSIDMSITSAKSAYDYVVSKYKFAQETNFLHRDVKALGSPVNDLMENKNVLITTIVTIAGLGISSIAVLALVKRKKHQA